MSNGWIAKWGAIGTMASVFLAVLYGLATMPRSEPDECSILPFPLIVSEE